MEASSLLPSTLPLAPCSKTLTLTQHRRRPSTILAAVSRSKKEATVAAVRLHLSTSSLVAGIRYQGLSVAALQALRAALPPSASLLVAKNTLLAKAVAGTPWAALAPCLTGMNAWLFVRGDEAIPAAIAPYREFQRERKLLETNDFSGAVFEGRFYAPQEVGELESMPTRAEVYGKLLGTLGAPAAALAGTIGAPGRDLVLVLRAYVKKLEAEEEAAASSQG